MSGRTYRYWDRSNLSPDAPPTPLPPAPARRAANGCPHPAYRSPPHRAVPPAHGGCPHCAHRSTRHSVCADSGCVPAKPSHRPGRRHPFRDAGNRHSRSRSGARGRFPVPARSRSPRPEAPNGERPGSRWQPSLRACPSLGRPHQAGQTQTCITTPENPLHPQALLVSPGGNLVIR